MQFNAQIGAVELSSIQSQRQRSHPAMDAAAKLLGMSSSDLRSALQSGKSLADVASSKGISQDTLTAAMAAAIQQVNPGVSSDQATKVATAIATRTPPAGGPPPDAAPGADATQGATGTTAARGHHHHHHHAGAAAMDAAAKALGMSASDLSSSLQSGQSLASIAKSKGVSQDDLVKAMAAALQGTDSGLSADQATQLATQMATRTPGTQNEPWAGAAAQAGTTTYSITA
jgi:lambda repressor-like predicted transcriptional regulator